MTAVIIFIIASIILGEIFSALINGMNRVSDGVRNKKIREEQANNPPKASSLADRYAHVKDWQDSKE